MLGPAPLPSHSTGGGSITQTPLGGGPGRDPASARAAATLSQHCLRWVRGQLEAAVSASGSAADAHGNAVGGKDVALLAKVGEELAVCLRTEAAILARSDSRGVAAAAGGADGVGGQTRSRDISLVLREGSHTSAELARREIVSLCASGDLNGLVGCSILVHWPLDAQWYCCDVLECNEVKREHLVRVSSPSQSSLTPSSTLPPPKNKSLGHSTWPPATLPPPPPSQHTTRDIT